MSSQTSVLEDELLSTRFVFEGILQPAVLSALKEDPRITHAIPDGESAVLIVWSEVNASVMDIKMRFHELVMLHESALNGRELKYVALEGGVLLLRFTERATPRL